MIREEIIIALLLLCPLVGFFICGLKAIRFPTSKTSGVIATCAVLASFVCGIWAFVRLLAKASDQRQLVAHFFQWISVGDFQINASFIIDPISIVMVLIITGVGTLIHLFSIGYMNEDKNPAKYFSYLNLFIFNMLILVLASNLPVMFIGWEGVGLCSYLLIGFWFSDPQKATAGMKAFVMNRIGDAALLLGMFFIFIYTESLEFTQIHAFATEQLLDQEATPLWITLAALLLFIGATGKSAQIPLYTWLPDAMAGPTPVSALIHAATMVTAGIYMIVRLHAFYLLTPLAMTVIAVVGIFTAVFAASIAVAQNDIKKILAYSTVSQLGYMFLAVGVGAFSSALFHLMTHAFFKALMFLGAGSVIHALNGEQDIRKMGQLKKEMPITYITFVIGWLAIIGFPLLSGFFSKDEILWMSFHSPRGHVVFWLLGVCGAALTAFYMTRLMSLTFWTKRSNTKIHPHESPYTMTLPLILLAILSLVGGYLGLPHLIGHPLHIPHFLEEWLPLIAVPGLQPPEVLLEAIMMALSVLVALGFAVLAFWIYMVKQNISLEKQYPRLYRCLVNKYWIDEIYDKWLVKPFVGLSQRLWKVVDIGLIDRATYKMTDIVRATGVSLSQLQNGNLQQYAMYMLIGLAIISAVLISTL